MNDASHHAAAGNGDAGHEIGIGQTAQEHGARYLHDKLAKPVRKFEIVAVNTAIERKITRFQPRLASVLQYAAFLQYLQADQETVFAGPRDIPASAPHGLLAAGDERRRKPGQAIEQDFTVKIVRTVTLAVKVNIGVADGLAPIGEALGLPDALCAQQYRHSPPPP